MLFLFPIYSYANNTTVPDFQSTDECRTWVQNYADTVDTTALYDSVFHDWLTAFNMDAGVTNKSCVDNRCTTWIGGNENGAELGGCGLIDDKDLADVWNIAKRNLVDMIKIYESKLELLPVFRYGKMCQYPKGMEDPMKGVCWIMMGGSESCATLNALNYRLHIPCLKFGNQTYWIEADLDLVVPSTFDYSGIGAGFSNSLTVDNCATFTASTGIIHIPCLRIGKSPVSFEKESYWADLKIVAGTNPVQFLVTAVEKNP